MSSGKAVACAIFAWHVVEWIYKDFPNMASNYKSKTDYQFAMKSICQSLQYIQDIANGSKHNGITMYAPSVKDTSRHDGGFLDSFSPESFSRESFDISGLKMTLDNGIEVFFDEEILKVRQFIQNYFVNTLGVDV